MRVLLRVCVFFCVAMALTACGGGSSSSGSSSSGGTPPPVETDTLRLSSGAVSFSATQYEEIPDSIVVTATVTGSNTAGIIFGTLPGVDDLPSWLDIGLGDLVNNSVDAEFRITTRDWPQSNNSFTVRAVTFDTNENVLDTADITVTYNVAEGVALSVAPESIDVVMHFASEPITEVMSVTAGNYEWAAFSSDANLDIEMATGSQDVTLTIFPPMQGLVDADRKYEGAVDVFQNETSNSSIFLIDFTVFPTLEGFREDIFLNAIAGEADGGEIGVNLKGQGLNWAATTDVPWLSFSAANGVVETDDLSVDSPEGDDFTVSVDGSTLTAGRHNATITVTAEAEQTLEIPVIIEVAPQIIMAAKHGIALSDTGAVSILEAVVDVDTNTSRNATWTASSNVNWLSVTPSGTVADDLVVTADPTALVNETTTGGIVTLSSSDSEITNTIDIHVGLWKSAAMPSELPVTVGGMFPEDLIVADPIRPLAYVHSGETEINIVNVYTGVVEKTLTPSAQVFNFDVSDDGAFLYLVRSGDGEGFIDVVDLDSQAITTTWTYTADRLVARDSQDVKFGRISNTPYIFTSTEVAINASTGETQAIYNKFPSSLQVQNNVFCGDTSNSVQPEFGCLDIVTAGFEGARVSSVARTTGETTGGQTRLAHNGERLYTINEQVISVYDTSDLSLIATLQTATEGFLEAAELDSSDRLYVTYSNEGEIPTEVDDPFVDPSRFVKVFGSDLTEISSTDYPSEGDGFLSTVSAIALSGDEQRIVYLENTNEGVLQVNFFSLD